MFRYNGPFMQKAIKFANILYVHFLTLICCIPLITVGAALTALEYVLLKIHNEEDSRITSLYFSSFKDNFVQGTIMWLIYFVIGLIISVNLIFLRSLEEQEYIFTIGSHVIAILLMMNFTWGFVMLSRYNNSAWVTMKYAMLASVFYIHYTIPMFLLAAGTIILAFWHLEFTAVALVVGSLLSGSLRPKMYSKVFEKIEKD